MKNVMLFTHHLNNGGAEKVVRTVAEYINSGNYGWTAWICVVYDDPELHKMLHNVIVLNHRSENTDNKVHKGINVLHQISEMKKIKRKLHIDVCISFLPGADIINVLSGTGEKQVVSVRSIESKFTHSIWKKIYVKCSYVKCDRIVAVSETVRHDCITYFGVPESKIETIYNPANLIKTDGECESRFIQFISDKFVCISVGRLDQAKGHAHLIRSFRKVADQIPKAALVIIGSGDLSDTLKRMIHELQLDNSILMMGYCPNPCDYMKSADLFIYPSNIDGMSNGVIEAMQCSLPVLSTDCGGPGEILAPEKNISTAVSAAQFYSNGMLVPACGDDIYDIKYPLTAEEEQLSSGIIRMINSKEQRDLYSERSQRCLEKLDLETIGKEWIELINHV